jgi:voltage-gated potassium channel
LWPHAAPGNNQGLEFARLHAAMPSQMPSQKIQKKVHIARRGVMYSLILCGVILLLGGAGFWLLEPHVHTFADGLWLAFTTAATVGYGDMVPSTHASRMFAVVVVLLGLAVLSLATASLSAIFVEKDVEEGEERQIDQELIREIMHLREDVKSLRLEILSAKTSRPLPAASELPAN